MKDQEYFKLFEERDKIVDKDFSLSKFGIEKDGYILEIKTADAQLVLLEQIKAKISQAKIEKRKQIKMLEEIKDKLLEGEHWLNKEGTDCEVCLLEDELSNKIKQLQEEIEHE